MMNESVNTNRGQRDHRAKWQDAKADVAPDVDWPDLGRGDLDRADLDVELADLKPERREPSLGLAHTASDDDAGIAAFLADEFADINAPADKVAVGAQRKEPPTQAPQHVDGEHGGPDAADSGPDIESGSHFPTPEPPTPSQETTGEMAAVTDKAFDASLGHRADDGAALDRVAAAPSQAPAALEPLPGPGAEVALAQVPEPEPEPEPEP
jgi:hypothetical protein